MRRAKKSQISEVDIFMDRSVIEIYINKGELVFTSKFYFPSEDRKIELLGFHKIEGWELEATINYSE